MTTRGHRKNDGLLRIGRVALFGAIAWLALSALNFRPTGVAVAIAAVVGIVAYFSPEVAALTFVIAGCLPILAVNAILGLVFLIAGVAAVQYFGSDDGVVFLVIGGAFVLAAIGPVWAVPVLAGYILGGSSGAIASVVACLLVEVAGIVLGFPRLGLVETGGIAATAELAAIVDVSKAPENLLSFGWLASSFRSISGATMTQLLERLSEVKTVGVLVFQPIVWGLAAATTARLRRPSSDPRQLAYGFASAIVGVAVLSLGTIAVFSIFGLEPAYDTIATMAVASFVISSAVIVLADRVFGVIPPPARESAPAATAAVAGTMAADDADVDELLRMIATAEEKIATEHTQNAVVMITDMKSFSKMTEEEGSVVTAKAIQRHRDLLIPVIESNHGCGKSTGGDGLVASFTSADDALRCAVAMQCTLKRHNAAHPREREITIRVGIASGEVVLDKGGRPFIGAGLNLAARVMNLGDGGQIMATRAVVDSGKLASVAVHSHGNFQLKNIAEPVEVLEVLWDEAQQPCDPRSLQE